MDIPTDLSELLVHDRCLSFPVPSLEVLEMVSLRAPEDPSLRAGLRESRGLERLASIPEVAWVIYMPALPYGCRVVLQLSSPPTAAERVAIMEQVRILLGALVLQELDRYR